MRRLLITLSASVFISGPVLADVPRVVTDILPVHGLVSQVMDDVGRPVLLVRPGASPHGYAMRPSEAAALQEADLVVRIGDILTPWLDRSIETLASNADDLPLLDHPSTSLLEARADADLGDHDDGHEHAHDHGDSGTDPHAWLDPENAVAWLEVIANHLADLDPENADTYRSNATVAANDITAAQEQIASDLAPLQDRPFIVFHDAYQYFENRFGLNVVGALAMSDAVDPGPARLDEIRTLVAEQGVVCAFAEPQFNDALLRAAFGTAPIRIATLDPLGTDLAPGPGLYVSLLKKMSQIVSNCLG